MWWLLVASFVFLPAKVLGSMKFFFVRKQLLKSFNNVMSFVMAEITD